MIYRILSIYESLLSRKFKLIIFFFITLSIYVTYLLVSNYPTNTNTVEKNITIPFSKIIRKSAAIAENSIEIYTIKPGMTLATIFEDIKLSKDTLYDITNISQKVKNTLKKLKPNQQIEYVIDSTNNLLTFEYNITDTEKLSIYKTSKGFKASFIKTALEKRIDNANVIVKSSLFTSGIKAGLSENIISKITNIFAWDIDFAKELQPGDVFTVIYESLYNKNAKKIKDGNIIAVQFLNKGKLYKAIKYTTSDGISDYFKPDGKSVKTAFMKTPVKFTRISSTFSTHRRHPILNLIRKHTGIDYAAPIGTPVKTTSDGKIYFVGRKGGYGKVIEVKHANNYSTLYGHLSNFAKNIKKGSTVKQGQVIGYVGKTGLATGPHLHYEFRINGKYVNPQKIKIPLSRSLAGKEKKKFLSLAGKLLSHLDTISKTSQIG